MFINCGGVAGGGKQKLEELLTVVDVDNGEGVDMDLVSFSLLLWRASML